jgi:hypothetical protein
MFSVIGSQMMIRFWDRLYFFGVTSLMAVSLDTDYAAPNVDKG